MLRILIVVAMLAVLPSCMSTGYRSETFYESGAIKSRRHVYNATVWHEAVKDTLSGVWDSLSNSTLGQIAIGSALTAVPGGALFFRGKRKSFNAGLDRGAKISRGETIAKAKP